MRLGIALAALSLFVCARATAEVFDLILRHGTVYDGSGAAPFTGDIYIRADRVVALGAIPGATAAREIDATGLAVAPGLINMLSWAADSMITDGRALSDLVQGVTLEVFGEGWTLGPQNERMKTDPAYTHSVGQPLGDWTTLGEALEFMERKGVAPNIASFVGATTLRVHEVGLDDRPATPEEIERMRALVRQAMEEGALGVGSSLIYAPAAFASTEELIALAQAAAPYGGTYISHMRSEGKALVASVDELIRIAEEGGVRGEIYHLKALGQRYWDQMDPAIARVWAARDRGVDVTANMYTYIASGTGLSVCFPPWVADGGHNELIKRLKDPEIRKRIIAEVEGDTPGWENQYLAAGSPEKILPVGFQNPKLRPLSGKTLAQISAERGKPPLEVAMDLVVEDDSRVGTIYFMMSEDNVKKQIALPWVTFGSDAPASAPRPGNTRKGQDHPRTWGNFARLLGHYVREEKVIPLEEAIHRLTALSAEHLKIRERGALRPGYFADVVLFDPNTIIDKAQFGDSDHLAEGVRFVLVNGTPVIDNGEFTGKFPGRFVRGPGWNGKTAATK